MTNCWLQFAQATLLDSFILLKNNLPGSYGVILSIRNIIS